MLLHRSIILMLVISSALALTACGAPGEGDEDRTTDTREGAPMSITVTSTAYEDGGTMPTRYANTGVEGGRNASPPLSWSGAPDGTASFALLMVDRHPVANDWVHWMVVDIPADVTSLDEGASGTSMPQGARELANTFGTTGYGGPQPPAGTGEHPYEVHVYALDAGTVDLPDDASLGRFEDAMDERTLAAGMLTGVFSR